MSCGVGGRRGLDPSLLWLWHRPAAIALLRPLAWELPYAAGAALEKAKRQEKKKKTTSLCEHMCHAHTHTHTQYYFRKYGAEDS